MQDEDAANAAANAIPFPMLFLIGTFIPLETMPDYLQVVKLPPLTYLNYDLRDVRILRDTASAFHKMSIVLVAGAVFFIIGRLSPIGESEADRIVERQYALIEAQNPKKFKKRKMQSVLHPA